MRIKYYGYTDKGRIRSLNEDAFLEGDNIFNNIDSGGNNEPVEINLPEKPFIIAIADGMGGHEGGEIASKYTLTNLIKKFRNDYDSSRTVEDNLRSAILSIHNDLIKYGNDINKLEMGTTLTGCLFFQNQMKVFNVGDSRLYIYDNNLVQITDDHTLQNETKIMEMPKNILTSCVGGGISYIKIDIFDITDSIKPNTFMFLCSDGISDYVTDNEISQIIDENKTDLTKMVRSMLIKSIDNNTRDNITGIAVQILE